ncbi:MAG: NAD-dependent epimerase/dehydratase family protein [Candidatus Dadabacteria bacterium]|nr:NAD-dependent epimerase/dehydratase family protein [Candidatus Dadabacteria bacterium]
MPTQRDKKSVLVTGGCGFIGVNLAARLLGTGRFAVTVLDNMSTGSAADLEAALSEHGLDPSGVTAIEGDVRDLALCEEACRGVDAVVHLAAQAGVPQSIDDPFRDADVNVGGTLNMLEAARRAGAGMFVFASSNAPLGAAPPPSREDTPPRPLSPYGAAKLAGEGYCSAYRASYGLPTVALRFSNAYGPWSLHKSSVVARFIKDGLSTGRLTVYGDGSQTRDLVHVDDITRAVELALDSGPEETAGGIFQLGTGAETAVLQVAAMVADLVGKGVRIDFAPARPGEAARSFSHIGRARALLGYAPEVTLGEGLPETLEWFRTHGGPALVRRPPAAVIVRDGKRPGRKKQQT